MAQNEAAAPAPPDETMRLNAAAIYCICFITSVLGEPEAIAIDNADNTRIIYWENPKKPEWLLAFASISVGGTVEVMLFDDDPTRRRQVYLVSGYCDLHAIQVSWADSQPEDDDEPDRTPDAVH